MQASNLPYYYSRYRNIFTTLKPRFGGYGQLRYSPICTVLGGSVTSPGYDHLLTAKIYTVPDKIVHPSDQVRTLISLK